MTTVDVPAGEVLVSQTTLILALIVSLGSAVAIAIQAIRWINKRIGRARAEADAKLDARIKELYTIIVDLKERSDYLHHRIIDGFFNEKGKDNQ